MALGLLAIGNGLVFDVQLAVILLVAGPGWPCWWARWPGGGASERTADRPRPGWRARACEDKGGLPDRGGRPLRPSCGVTDACGLGGDGTAIRDAGQSGDRPAEQDGQHAHAHGEAATPKATTEVNSEARRKSAVHRGGTQRVLTVELRRRSCHRWPRATWCLMMSAW